MHLPGINKPMNNWLDYNLAATFHLKFTVYQLISLIFIIGATFLVLRVLKRILNREVKTRHIDSGRGYAMYQIIKYMLFVIAISLVLKVFGFDITILVAGSAALLVGVGFGIQQIFNDFVSGILLLVEGSIKVKDIIEVDNMVARVDQIGLRTSTITTRDDISMIIPNSKLVSEKVINWTHNESPTRFKISIGVAYSSDAEEVRKILIDVAGQHKGVLTNPKPFVRLLDFGDSSVVFELYFWTLQMFEIENIKSELRFDIFDQFNKSNVVIPFPQRDVYIKENAGK